MHLTGVQVEGMCGPWTSFGHGVVSSMDVYVCRTAMPELGACTHTCRTNAYGVICEGWHCDVIVDHVIQFDHDCNCRMPYQCG